MMVNDTLQSYPPKEIDKIRVRKAEIVVHGTTEKPYYEIEYIELDWTEHIGYSSYKLENVQHWLSECFEIVTFVPAIYGEWVQKESMLKHIGARNYYCSNCGMDTAECGNYCSNCGAKMKT